MEQRMFIEPGSADETPVLACLAILLPWQSGSVSSSAPPPRRTAPSPPASPETWQILRDRTDDPEFRLLTMDTALTQQAQIGRMHGWLDCLEAPGDELGAGPGVDGRAN